MEGCIHEARKTMKKFICPKNKDVEIPEKILKNAKGIAFITEIKAGFIWSGMLGRGIVIARKRGTEREWSGPIAIGTAGVGCGGLIGGTKINAIIVLNSWAAVKAFSGKAQVKLGGDVSMAAGPVGRDATADVHLGKAVAACFTYSHSAGLYAGISLDGAILILMEKDTNKFYGNKSSADEILSGIVKPPQTSQDLQQIYDVLNQYVFEGNWNDSEVVTTVTTTVVYPPPDPSPQPVSPPSPRGAYPVPTPVPPPQTVVTTTVYAPPPIPLTPYIPPSSNYPVPTPYTTGGAPPSPRSAYPVPTYPLPTQATVVVQPAGPPSPRSAYPVSPPVPQPYQQTTSSGPPPIPRCDYVIPSSGAQYPPHSYAPPQQQQQPQVTLHTPAPPSRSPQGSPRTVPQQPLKARALYDCTPTQPRVLHFKANDIITINKQDGEWWEAEKDGLRGYVPANYVTIIT